MCESLKVSRRRLFCLRQKKCRGRVCGGASPSLLVYGVVLQRSLDALLSHRVGNTLYTVDWCALADYRGEGIERQHMPFFAFSLSFISLVWVNVS